MDNKKEYRCVTTAAGIRAYIGNAKVAAFDYETSPDDEYRDDDKAALDPAKSHICTMSISVRPGTGIEIPFAHKTGINISREEFTRFLEGFLTDTSIVKIAHNLSFESMFSYKYGIVIQEPVYDTIAASQMTLKTGTDFRRLQDSGLKKLSEELLHGCGETVAAKSAEGYKGAELQSLHHQCEERTLQRAGRHSYRA